MEVFGARRPFHQAKADVEADSLRIEGFAPCAAM
jgi:hypothetical protein